MVVATLVLADLSLTTVIWWLIVGLIAGFLASLVMRGGYGIVGDIVVGLVGASLCNNVLEISMGRSPSFFHMHSYLPSSTRHICAPLLLSHKSINNRA